MVQENTLELIYTMAVHYAGVAWAFGIIAAVSHTHLESVKIMTVLLCPFFAFFSVVCIAIVRRENQNKSVEVS